MKTKVLYTNLLQIIFIGLSLVTIIYVRVVTAGASQSVYAGNTAVLNCDGDPGDSLIMFTWKVFLQNGSICTLSFIVDNDTYNGCSNRIQMNRNMSLIIHNSKITDEGNYTCEIVNAVGTIINTTILRILVQPCVTLKSKRDGTAHCEAIGGYPAAKITWIPESDGLITTDKVLQPDKSWTIISTYRPKYPNVTEVTCVVSHPTFAHPQNRSVAISNSGGNTELLVLLIPIIGVLTIGLILYCKRSKIRFFRHNVKGSAAESAQSPSEQNKEDVEPYASFTQKVNTIYSTASMIPPQ
ncbi:cell surface glycoprotein CD200 receptor 1-B isoform X2 [Bombina bombina]|uniref:cell surface glycoprotein CD200 receptor 1-B isoform X2 n=1 Tax=Bombina bombina TaxID=8345 RepID=UPI00235A8E3C|nr:cell surface glycoprotein CD200 receptor 1-B isoform X2 [Bombina bombina]